MPNNIRKLRIHNGWSMEMLAQKIGTTTSTINRLETDQTKLVSEWLDPLARVFGVRWTALIGDDETPDEWAISCEAKEFVPDANHALHGISLGKDRVLYCVLDDSLSAIGIAPGDIVVVDVSDQAIASTATGDAVIIRLVHQNAATGSVLCARQHLEPDLFTTNAAGDGNKLPVNRKVQSATIVGRIVTRISVIGQRR